MWDDDSYLLQLPHFTRKDCKIFKEKYKVKDVFELLEMSDEDRNEALTNDCQFNEQQKDDIANVCNQYPNVDVQFTLLNNTQYILPNQEIHIHVEIEREMDDEDEEETEETQDNENDTQKDEEKENGWFFFCFLMCGVRDYFFFFGGFETV